MISKYPPLTAAEIINANEQARTIAATTAQPVRHERQPDPRRMEELNDMRKLMQQAKADTPENERREREARAEAVKKALAESADGVEEAAGYYVRAGGGVISFCMTGAKLAEEVKALTATDPAAYAFAVKRPSKAPTAAPQTVFYSQRTISNIKDGDTIAGVFRGGVYIPYQLIHSFIDIDMYKKIMEQ